VTAFWGVVGAGLAWWVRRDMGRDAADLHGLAANLESALTRNLAEVYDLRAAAFVAFEEIEDEGACYAFALPGDQLAFVTGQEFYEGARFPSLDFSLVYLLDERDRPVDMLIDKRGSRALPARTIPAATKRALVLPEHLQVIDGRPDDLELRLSSLERREQ